MSRLIPLLAALALAAGAVHAAPSAPFTATYEVLRSGQRVGEASMSLQRDGDDWRFATVTHGNLGPAGLLGIDTTEISRFRRKDGAPEMLAYDFRLDSSLKKSRRHVEVDRSAQRVRVDDSRKGRSDYASEPALVDRHLLVLALGQSLARGDRRDVDLAVAVRDRVKHQTYRVGGEETVVVPAGRFDDALRVERGDRDHDFVAWYAPAHYPVPLKVRYGERMELRLANFTATRDK